MSSMLGASSPLGGASSRERISSWIIRPLTGRPAPVSVLAPIATWAARTIFGRPQAHVLDSVGSHSKNGFRVRRRLAVLVGLIALASPAATTAGQATDPHLQERLAKALRVPHVAPASSAAIALDLSTGTVLYSQNAGR